MCKAVHKCNHRGKYLGLRRRAGMAPTQSWETKEVFQEHVTSTLRQIKRRKRTMPGSRWKELKMRGRPYFLWILKQFCVREGARGTGER